MNANKNNHLDSKSTAWFNNAGTGTKRSLSLMLALAIVGGLMAFAPANAKAAHKTVTRPKVTAHVSVGHDQPPVEWIAGIKGSDAATQVGLEGTFVGCQRDLEVTPVQQRPC